MWLEPNSVTLRNPEEFKRAYNMKYRGTGWYVKREGIVLFVQHLKEGIKTWEWSQDPRLDIKRALKLRTFGPLQCEGINNGSECLQ